ncbi:MAG: DddA-like double-stranded DNA deaminase toxin [Cyanobacteria bacterium P01_G01_bin.54]
MTTKFSVQGIQEIDVTKSNLPNDRTSAILEFGDNQSIQLWSDSPVPQSAILDEAFVNSLSDDARKALRHTEGHAAAIMRANDISEATLHINYAGGPCVFCLEGIGEILKPGQRLYITYPYTDVLNTTSANYRRLVNSPLDTGTMHVGRGYFTGGTDEFMDAPY